MRPISRVAVRAGNRLAIVFMTVRQRIAMLRLASPITNSFSDEDVVAHGRAHRLSDKDRNEYKWSSNK
jgi:hypothetical protein